MKNIKKIILYTGIVLLVVIITAWLFIVCYNLGINPMILPFLTR